MLNPFLVVLVGVPCAGKSTFISNNEHDAVIISSDDYIQEKADEEGITYDEAFPKFISEANRKVWKDAGEAFRAGKTVIWDQTNLSRTKRKKILNLMRKNSNGTEYVTIAVMLETDLDKILKRNMERAKTGKSIPEDVIRGMLDQLEEPSEDEGFDIVKKIRS